MPRRRFGVVVGIVVDTLWWVEGALRGGLRFRNGCINDFIIVF